MDERTSVSPRQCTILCNLSQCSVIILVEVRDNLFEWHFTVRGAPESEFEDGLYHGRITFPPEYPMKPPSIMLLTPNGRFEIGKKICLSISGYHPETWQPSWSIRTVLLAIIGFMPTHGHGAIGSLDYTSDERKILAKRSREWKCKECGDLLKNVLKEKAVDSETSKEENEEAKALAAQINFKEEKKRKAASENNDRTTANLQDTASTQQSLSNSLVTYHQQFMIANLNSQMSQQPILEDGMMHENVQGKENSGNISVQQSTPQSQFCSKTNEEVPSESVATNTNKNLHNVRYRYQTQQTYEQQRKAEETQPLHSNHQVQQQGQIENRNYLVLIVLLSLLLAALMLRRLCNSLDDD
ncbi:ubiquitin-conjugating enzyme E2 J1-like isoform X2 [Ptychodera flava]|uniref:ubiquitin-conjugating enzyme E2 J1-like isoform X2 n=1 Tax=Ptychodera flava TaxID=63121 RepID=UPI00396A9AC0